YMGPPVGGLFSFKFSSRPHPRKFGLKRFLAVRKVLARKWGACFWATSLQKISSGVIALISFRLTWDGCGSLLPCGGVLSFQSEAREASGRETARVHHCTRRRGRVAARGAGAAERHPRDRPALAGRHAPRVS